MTLPHGLWSSVWFATTHDHIASFPNTLTMIVLASNFGTFMLYMLSCIIVSWPIKDTRTSA